MITVLHMRIFLHVCHFLCVVCISLPCTFMFGDSFPRAYDFFDCPLCCTRALLLLIFWVNGVDAAFRGDVNFDLEKTVPMAWDDKINYQAKMSYFIDVNSVCLICWVLLTSQSSSAGAVQVGPLQVVVLFLPLLSQHILVRDWRTWMGHCILAEGFCWVTGLHETWTQEADSPVTRMPLCFQW